jgi:hypothetical protein
MSVVRPAVRDVLLAGPGRAHRPETATSAAAVEAASAVGTARYPRATAHSAPVALLTSMTSTAAQDRRSRRSQPMRWPLLAPAGVVARLRGQPPPVGRTPRGLCVPDRRVVRDTPVLRNTLGIPALPAVATSASPARRRRRTNFETVTSSVRGGHVGYP